MSLPGSQVMSVGGDHEDRGDEGVDGRKRQQDLPAEAHQLVVAQARQRGADPDEQHHEDEHLASITKGSTQPGGWIPNGNSQPPRNIVAAMPEATSMLRYSAK